MNLKKYHEIAKKNEKKEPLLLDSILAFFSGGIIGLIEGGKIEGRSTAAQWAFGIWNPANSTIKEIKDGEIYALGEHNYQNSSPNFIALSNEGNVNIISGGLFYASSLHEKGSTFAIRNRGIISSL